MSKTVKWWVVFVSAMTLVGLFIGVTADNAKGEDNCPPKCEELSQTFQANLEGLVKEQAQTGNSTETPKGHLTWLENNHPRFVKKIKNAYDNWKAQQTGFAAMTLPSADNWWDDLKEQAEERFFCAMYTRAETLTQNVVEDMSCLADKDLPNWASNSIANDFDKIQTVVKCTASAIVGTFAVKRLVDGVWKVTRAPYRIAIGTSICTATAFISLWFD